MTAFARLRMSEPENFLFEDISMSILGNINIILIFSYDVTWIGDGASAKFGDFQPAISKQADELQIATSTVRRNNLWMAVDKPIEWDAGLLLECIEFIHPSDTKMRPAQ